MAERYIPEHRRSNFKAKGTFKPEELRRRREEQQVEIRKAKRDENLAKRRGLTGGDLSQRPGASLGAAPDSDDDTAPTESQVRRNCMLAASLIFSYLELLVLRNLGRISPPYAGLSALFCLHLRFTPLWGFYFRYVGGSGHHHHRLMATDMAISFCD